MTDEAMPREVGSNAGLGVNAPRAPGTRLTVVFRDDGPMIHCGDSPAYRSVSVALTEDQLKALALRHCGSHGYDVVSRCFIDA